MQNKNESFYFHSRGEAYLRRRQSRANRVECKIKTKVFIFIPEVQSIFAAGKVVQTEWNAK